ncbi:hypothetical protein VOLCADRAFT_108569 [Volvox carteri f. nagariensis]|uniref:Uncharacterized protein n=1 Tax=Volvox carteri f. nagariensis TaxID=3068 RepID=D8UL12_VOLCA|nr:uncharacterized protein VOLCADRAFT_108569 [Volvox carteri f. nagariensis]EFJ39584.1 hypothetical protein VOLCADRAFT_108569 [Volvox carteri f. nagariensis]|eukprot:XP_002959348.1 hypothetical protein VOLCADRAFT_108569 [Volvox carteri f. nagariensis]
MTTIREALAAVRGETEATVAPILQALQAEGFDVDAEAGDAFCLLDVSYLRSHLNLRQLTALKAAIKTVRPIVIVAPLHVGRQTTLCTLSGDRVYDVRARCIVVMFDDLMLLMLYSALMLAPATLLQVSLLCLTWEGGNRFCGLGVPFHLGVETYGVIDFLDRKLRFGAS